jgi:spore coat polysaccharide biosynthesis protein SpsF (cytidylyltransferase family)
MKYLAMIQARCGSMRFPSKVLKDLCGKTVLERMIDRVQKSKYIDELIVVTTINTEDLPIIRLVSGLGLRVFAGSSGDVLDRFYQAAKLIQPEFIIRLTADCPVFDFNLLDEAIEALSPSTDDLRMLSETFPDGLDLEILRYSVLEDIWRNAKLLSEREHVTLYIKNHLDKYNVQDFVCKLGNLHDQRWTIDEPEDLLFIETLYKHFTPKWDFTMAEIYELLLVRPDIKAINKGFIRNEGLLKSLAHDTVIDSNS